MGQLLESRNFTVQEGDVEVDVTPRRVNGVNILDFTVKVDDEAVAETTFDKDLWDKLVRAVSDQFARILGSDR
jgi:hypothetical protein